MRRAPYGSWQSPITSELIVQGAARLGGVVLAGGVTYVAESRPSEKGRTVLARIEADGASRDIVPAPFDTRTRVHEYGGGAFTVDRGIVYFSHFADGRLYRSPADGSAVPDPITPAGALRFAAPRCDNSGGRIFAVLEDH